jgi:lipopolysaccharide transport system ATP-binding protein
MYAIQANHVTKRYPIYRSRWDRLLDLAAPARAARRASHTALKDVSFNVAPGEALGILGRNGAGKSTLLKIVTGTTKASAGSVSTAGRVAALLELGMGFHPEFTGRQNLVISGQLLGFSIPELRERLPEIEAFADIGDYIDEPVRTYSSGMQVRLAFAVATAVRPEILIVDEALSVGDVFFQQKCFERIERFKKQGTTLLFVSHDTGVVHHLCDRAILMERGEIRLDGSPKSVIDLYHSTALASLDRAGSDMTLASGSAAGDISTAAVEITNVRVLDESSKPVTAVISDAKVRVVAQVLFNRASSDPHVGFKIRDRLGRVMYETNSYCMGRRIGAVAAGGTIEASFELALSLAPGDYTVTIGVAEDGFQDASFRQVLALANDQAELKIAPNRGEVFWSGMINLRPSFSSATQPARISP